VCWVSYKTLNPTYLANLNALSFWAQNKALAVGLDGAILEFDTQFSSGSNLDLVHMEDKQGVSLAM
jgi:hypothetical protein